MPIMARRPFLISERRFSASCWELSFLVKPGVSQTATARRRRRSEGMRHTTCTCRAAETLVHLRHQIRRMPSRGHAYPWEGRGGGGGGGSQFLRNLRLPGSPPLV